MCGCGLGGHGVSDADEYWCAVWIHLGTCRLHRGLDQVRAGLEPSNSGRVEGIGLMLINSVELDGPGGRVAGRVPELP